MISKLNFLIFSLFILLSLNMIFALEPNSPNCVLLSRTPTDINANSTGYYNYLIRCDDESGINTTKIGSQYSRFFITRTVDNFVLASGVPNYFMNTYPNNSLSVVGVLTPQFKIWRAMGRNEGDWYENLIQFNQSLTNDTFSYAVNDGRYGFLELTELNSTTALINFTGRVELNSFRTSFPLSFENLVSNKKYPYFIDDKNTVLVKMFDAEAYRNAENYTKIWFLNMLNNGTQTRLLNVYYCNYSFDPTNTIKPTSSSNCGLLISLTKTQVNNTIFSISNSSYFEFSSGVNNGYIAGKRASSEYYLYFQASGGMGGDINQWFRFRFANGSTETDVQFNDTNTTFISTDSGGHFALSPRTMDIFSTSARNYNEQMQVGFYIEDKLGNSYGNFSFFVDDISPTNHPITNPFIYSYNSSGYIEDEERNKNHSGIMNIFISPSIDPDSIGNVTHRLALINIDGSYNYTINVSFKASGDNFIYIPFNTSLVNDGVYRMNLSAISGDNFLDRTYFLTINNFSILNKYPINASFSLFNPPSSFNQSAGNFTLFIDVTNPLNYSVIYHIYNSIYNNVTLSFKNNFTFSNLDDGIYYYNITAISSNGLNKSLSTRYLIVDRNSPVVLYLSPVGITVNNTNVIFAVNLSENQSVLNVSGIKNITISVYNESYGLANQTTIINITNIYDILLSIPLTLYNGIFSWIVTAYDYASNSVVTLSSYFTVQDGSLDFNITYPQNKSYNNNISFFIFEIAGNYSGCYFTNNFGNSNSSFSCNSLSVPFNSTDGNNTITMYSYNYLNMTYKDEVTFKVGCINPSVIFSIDEYPYIEVNKTYTIRISPFYDGSSTIKLNLENLNTSHSIYNLSYDSFTESYSISLLFDEVGDYPFIIYSPSIYCPTLEENISGVFLVRQPSYIIIKGYNNKSAGLFVSNKYYNEFAYIIAEHSTSQKYYDSSLEKYITPLNFKYTYNKDVYHASYRNGEAILKLYDNSTPYVLRLIDGDIDFNSQYGTLNMSKSYGTNVYLGQVLINGTNKTLSVLLTNDDLYPYTKLINWITFILITIVFLISLGLLLFFPSVPSFSIIFGILFTLALIFIRVVFYVMGY